MTYDRTTSIAVVGWLYVLTGVTMLIAPFFTFQAAGGLAVNGLVVALGVVVLAAGAGLLRLAPLAWPLTLAIALSGATRPDGRRRLT